MKNANRRESSLLSGVCRAQQWLLGGIVDKNNVFILLSMPYERKRGENIPAKNKNCIFVFFYEKIFIKIYLILNIFKF